MICVRTAVFSAACENRTVAMVRNTIWTIPTHTAAVVLSELQQRLAGTKPRACKYKLQQINVMGDGPQVRQQLDNVQRVSTTRAAVKY